MTSSNKAYLYPIFTIILVVAIKCLFSITHHIQEDAFITWRVAQNLLDYGVIGFNGNIKISASTTHLYVFVSYVFNLIFGKEHFIYPLLIFNSLLFTIGSYFLSKILLKKTHQQVLFIVLVGFLPPAIKISILGMEYGMLFFLEMALLYFGFFHNKKWALVLFPILILWTRIDTVIFLGIVFLVDLIYHKKWRWSVAIGGASGVLTLLAFNWFYFNEWVNNTIVAKQISYSYPFDLYSKTMIYLRNFGNFFGMIKIDDTYNPHTILVLIFEILAFIFLLKKKEVRNPFLIMIFIFAWIKQSIFILQLSFFDWYFWVPQLLLFSIIIVYVLEIEKQKYFWLACFIGFYILPMLAFQTIHSIATGNGEWNYRRNIGVFLGKYEKNKNQWILLEPAGFVPYFSGLKTIDEVGLVDKEIHKEIIADRNKIWVNTISKRRPKYLLSYKDLFQSSDSGFYKQRYRLLKEFRIKNYLKSDCSVLEKIYHLKPSGTDYNLYEKKK